MTTDYSLILRTGAGVKLAEIDDYTGLTYSKRVNEPGLCQFTINADDVNATALATTNAQIEVWRSNAAMGLTRSADFYGLVRYVRRYYAERDVLEVRAVGQLSMLGWRTVAWHANTDNRSSFTSEKGETVMKALVTYNAASSATVANGRLREGAITGVSVAADGAAGSTIDWFCSYDNLLTTLQDCAKVAGGDFDLIRTGAATWEFRWYTGQRGTDRSATVFFSLGAGNMADPDYTIDRIDERTVAIVGGQGEGAARTTAVRTGTDYSAGVVDYEVFVDGRDCTTTAGLNTRGDKALDGKRAREVFTFKVLQTPACFYGVHYFLGDKATARYATLTETVKVHGVTVTSPEPGGENIDVEARTV